MTSMIQRDSSVTRVDCNHGKDYLLVLRDMHAWLDANVYLEIGVSKGAALKLALADTVAVDPKLLINSDVIGSKKVCQFAQMTSDEFFRSGVGNTILASQKVSLAFLDGLHEYETLLRDFANTERYATKNSVILMHDCVPTDIYMARRGQFDEKIRSQTKTPASWTGDVWKTILILREIRPDLKIISSDASPTGLVFITNLDPDSNAIWDNYGDIIDKYRNIELKDYGLSKYIYELDLLSTNDIDAPSKVRHLLGLDTAGAGS